jgi:hypothetical protein
VLVAYSLSHSVKPIRWNFGCAPAPKGGKKLSYRGESLFVVSHEGETYVDTMVENTRIVGTNEDAVKRVVDKLSEKKTTLDVPGELGKLYEEFAGKYPIVAVAANDRGEVAAFLNQMKPKDSADPMVAVKEYLGFDPEGIRMLAAGAKVISADRIEAGGVAFCADAPTAAALAEAINKNVQRPGGPGTWSFKTTATATDDRVDVQFELIGVKELALEQIAAAEEAAKKAATPSPATPKETPTAAGPAPSPATAETPKSDAPGR